MLLGKERLVRKKSNPLTGTTVKEIYNPDLNRYYCRVHQNFEEGYNIHTQSFEALCIKYRCTD